MSVCEICPLEAGQDCKTCQIGNSEAPANIMEFVREASMEL